VLSQQVDHHVAALNRARDVVERADGAVEWLHHPQITRKLEVPDIHLVATMRHHDAAANLAELVHYVLAKETGSAKDGRCDAAHRRAAAREPCL